MSVLGTRQVPSHASSLGWASRRGPPISAFWSERQRSLARGRQPRGGGDVGRRGTRLRPVLCLPTRHLASTHVTGDICVDGNARTSVVKP